MYLTCLSKICVNIMANQVGVIILVKNCVNYKTVPLGIFFSPCMSEFKLMSIYDVVVWREPLSVRSSPYLVATVVFDIVCICFFFCFQLKRFNFFLMPRMVEDPRKKPTKEIVPLLFNHDYKVEISRILWESIENKNIENFIFLLIALTVTLLSIFAAFSACFPVFHNNNVLRFLC